MDLYHITYSWLGPLCVLSQQSKYKVDSSTFRGLAIAFLNNCIPINFLAWGRTQGAC